MKSMDQTTKWLKLNLLWEKKELQDSIGGELLLLLHRIREARSERENEETETIIAASLSPGRKTVSLVTTFAWFHRRYNSAADLRDAKRTSLSLSLSLYLFLEKKKESEVSAFSYSFQRNVKGR